MSFKKRQAAAQGRVLGKSGLKLTIAYALALVVLYIGERLVIESTGLRIGMAAVAVAAIIYAVIGRLGRLRSLSEDAQPIEKRLLFCYLGGALALLFYLASSDFVMEMVRASFDSAKGADRWYGVFSVAWVVLLTCSLLPLLFIEISYADMDTRRTVDIGRIKRSSASALVLAMSLCLVFVLNFIATQYNSKVDLSYFKTTRPSESSKRMVKNLTKPVTVYLFFPGESNEVAEQVESYFLELKAQSKLMTIKKVDHVVQPDLAKKLSVRRNGVVVIKREKRKTQVIRVGTRLRRARRILRKLDSEFQAAFLKGARAQKIACMTTGHGELSRRPRKGKRGTSIRVLMAWAKRFHFRIKQLGLAEGLGSEVPKDCTLLIVADPQGAFHQSEVLAVKKYLTEGGRALIFIDPLSEWDGASLLGPFGLKLGRKPLANSRYALRITRTPADRQFIFSRRFSSHPSVRTLARAYRSRRALALFYRAGSISRIPSTKNLGVKVRFPIHSMPYTFADLNGNYRLDPKTEKRGSFELAAVVTMGKARKKKLPSAKDKKGKKKDAQKDEPPQMRLIVIPDGDVFSDRVMGWRPNQILFADMLLWLGGDEQYQGAPTSEEDVKIRHTTKEDRIWFYLTIFAVPALVLVGGLFYTRRRRKA